MDNETIELLTKRIMELEKKLEIYYQILKIENELSFILNGTYVFKTEIDEVVNGTY